MIASRQSKSRPNDRCWVTTSSDARGEVGQAGGMSIVSGWREGQAKSLPMLEFERLIRRRCILRIRTEIRGSSSSRPPLRWDMRQDRVGGTHLRGLRSAAASSMLRNPRPCDWPWDARRFESATSRLAYERSAIGPALLVKDACTRSAGDVRACSSRMDSVCARALGEYRPRCLR